MFDGVGNALPGSTDLGCPEMKVGQGLVLLLKNGRPEIRKKREPS
jgi:hypothetical protein